MKHLSNRQKLIIYLLSEKEWITAKELSVHLDVSIRSIKQDIKGLRESFNQDEEMIISKPGRGYALKKNVDAFNFFEEDYPLKEIKNIHRYTKSNADRISFLLQRFLIEEKYQKITDLSSMLYVSEATVHQDLQDVREILRSYDLRLESKPFYGLKLQGKESDQQTALLDFIFYNRLGLVDEALYRQFFFKKEEKLAELKQIINHVSEKNAEKFASWVVENIVYVCLITLQRAEDRSMREESLILEDRKYYVMAQEIIDEMQNVLEIEKKLKEEDYIWIATHLESKRRLPFHVEVSEPIQALSMNIYREIQNNFNIDFSEKKVLYDATSRHLHQLIHRHQRGVLLRNKALKNHLGKDLFALKISISAMDIVAQKIPGFILNTDEIAYLSMHFQYGLTMQKRSQTSRSLYFIDDYVDIYRLYYGHEIKRHFENKGHQVHIGSQLPEKKYDLVLAMKDYSTSNQDVLFLEHSEYMEQIAHSLKQLDFNRQQLERFMSPDYLLLNLKGRNKEEVMQAFYQQLRSLDLLKETSVQDPFVAHEIAPSVMHVHDLKKVVDH